MAIVVEKGVDFDKIDRGDSLKKKLIELFDRKFESFDSFINYMRQDLLLPPSINIPNKLEIEIDTLPFLVTSCPLLYHKGTPYRTYEVGRVRVIE